MTTEKWHGARTSMAHRVCLNYVGDPALMAPGYAFPTGDELRAAGVDARDA